MQLFNFQDWLLTERRSGTSFHRGTGSTRTVRGRTGRREAVTGRQPGRISQLVSRKRLG